MDCGVRPQGHQCQEGTADLRGGQGAAKKHVCCSALFLQKRAAPSSWVHCRTAGL